MGNIIWTGTLLATLTLPAQSSSQHHTAAPAHTGVTSPHAMDARYDDLQWQTIVGATLTSDRRLHPLLDRLALQRQAAADDSL